MKRGEDVTEFVDKAVAEALEKVKKEEVMCMSKHK